MKKRTKRIIWTLVLIPVVLAIVVVYLLKTDKKVLLFRKGLLARDPQLRRDYMKVYFPIMCSTVLWGVSVPMQTAILGHLTANAIAANSVTEAKIENLLLAKGFVDCIALLGDDGISVVIVPEKPGLEASDVAKISDEILAETDLDTTQIRVIESQ